MTRSPEQQYLIALATAWAHGQTDPVPPPAGVDPATIGAVMTAHNVEAALGALMPASLHDEALDTAITASRTRTANLLLECERILPVLSRHADRPVLLKGAALALHHYPDPGQRWFIDLDVLVPRRVVAGLCRDLEECGYRPLPGGRDPRFYEKYHLHRILLGPAGACLEIHWDLTLPGSVYRLSGTGVTARARPQTLGRHQIWWPTPVDQILHAVYQNIADGYLDLRRVLDMALLVRRLSAAESTLLADLAARSGLARGLALSLHIVKCVTGVDSGPQELLADQIGPAGWRLVRGLDPVAGCLDRAARSQDGYTALLHLLTTPRDDLRLREAARLLWVGEERLLNMGYQAENLPGIVERARLALRQASLLVRVGGLAANAFARS